MTNKEKIDALSSVLMLKNDINFNDKKINTYASGVDVKIYFMDSYRY